MLKALHNINVQTTATSKEVCEHMNFYSWFICLLHLNLFCKNASSVNKNWFCYISKNAIAEAKYEKSEVEIKLTPTEKSDPVKNESDAAVTADVFDVDRDSLKNATLDSEPESTENVPVAAKFISAAEPLTNTEVLTTSDESTKVSEDDTVAEPLPKTAADVSESLAEATPPVAPSVPTVAMLTAAAPAAPAVPVKAVSNEEMEYKTKLAEKRRLAREKAEREIEEEKRREEKKRYFVYS